MMTLECVDESLKMAEGRTAQDLYDAYIIPLRRKKQQHHLQNGIPGTHHLGPDLIQLFASMLQKLTSQTRTVQEPACNRVAPLPLLPSHLKRPMKQAQLCLPRKRRQKRRPVEIKKSASKCIKKEDPTDAVNEVAQAPASASVFEPDSSDEQNETAGMSSI